MEYMHRDTHTHTHIHAHTLTYTHTHTHAPLIMCAQAAGQRCDAVIAAVLAISEQHCKDFAGEEVRPIPPTAVVLCSAATGTLCEGIGRGV